jgi:hypothetical protein
MDHDEERGLTGMLTSARSLFDRVIDRVRGAIPRGRDEPHAARVAAVPSEGEPIVTRTMAGLLISQGHDERALAIYEQLIEASPDDRALRAEADAIKRRLQRRAAGAHVDAVVAVAARGQRLLVSWQLDETALARARAVLGVEGEVAARAVIVAASGASDVRSDVREIAGLDASGEWVLDAVPEGARCACAVGVAAGGRFVSAGHARTVVMA